MSVIMGGSGSTGSSLVKNILNRHADVFAGGETSFFAKHEIYENWSKAKYRVTKRKFRGLRNFGFHIYNGTDLDEAEYLLERDEIQEMASASSSLSDFCDSYYWKALEETEAKFWLEKTPANVACFGLYLESMEDGKVIHMVRNPFDTIASLWARGYDLYYAVGIYLLNTSSGLSARKYNGRYHEMKYEDVVNKPKETIDDVCKFLNIEFDPHILVSQNEKIEVSQLSGWNYDETADIGAKSLGRFAKLSKEKQDLIIEAVNIVSVSNSGRSYYNIKLSTIEEICGALDYEYHKSTSCNSIDGLKRDRKKDRLNRIKRGYATGFNYPLELSK